MAEPVSSASAAQTLCSKWHAVVSSPLARRRSTCTWDALLLGRILEFCSSIVGQMMTLIWRFVVNKQEKKVYKLIKSLYSLKQKPK